MDNNKNARIWQWAALLLVLCNIALIITIWKGPHHDGPPMREGSQTRDYVIQQLKFTDAQVKQYDTLIAAHRLAMHQLHKESEQCHEQLFANMKDNKLNADSLAQIIANNQKQVEIVTYKHFAAVRTLCTDDQKITFDNIIADVMHRMAGGPGAPHDGREGPPPGREGPPPPPPDAR